MSVLIKGMEMPKNCIECKLRDDMACCLPLDSPTEDRWVGRNEDKREPDCPLIELPEHGDVVQVVRCKNCKWWGLSEYNTFGIHVCKKFSGVRGESDYCSRAERSEE